MVVWKRKEICILKIFKKYVLVLLLSLLIVQISFYYIQINYEKSVVSSIQILLNQETVSSNPYNIVKGLESLESIGLISCSKLIQKESKNIFSDSSFKGKCKSSFFEMSGRNLTINLKALSGQSWIIEYFSKTTFEFRLLLWIVRGLVCILSLSFLRLYEWKINSILIEKNMELASQKQMSEIATQVAHDIRSPLIALTMTLDDIDTIPRQYRQIIKSSVERINDIANNLLNSNKDMSLINESSEELIGPLVDSLVSEKRQQLKLKGSITIELDLVDSYGLFVKVNPNDFKRVLSNLINNSIEAIEAGGKIIIYIKEVLDEKILISLHDNGKGIPAEILNRIGEKGYSYGKENSFSGNGLGVSHAKNIIALYDGKLEINSSLNIGTIVNITLPKAQQPSWFVKEILIHENQKILVLDDDEGMLHAWSDKINQEVLSFTNDDIFLNYVKNIKTNDFLCLIDYEFHGKVKNGIELIKLLGIENNSILVTSRFEEKEIIESCKQYGIRLIPKILASLVPIRYLAVNVNEIYDYVFIDDEEILRMSWENKARKLKIRLLSLNSTKFFNQHLGNICKKTTCIYIDSNLGNEDIKGEDFAAMLHLDGYEKIFISSGHNKDYFSHLPWLNYAGKKRPF
jgi:signal transduction histidine kinase